MLKEMFSHVTYNQITIFLIVRTNNLCCPSVHCNEYHMLPNKQQIHVTNLRIRAHIDEKFMQPIRT